MTNKLFKITALGAFALFAAGLAGTAVTSTPAGAETVYNFNKKAREHNKQRTRVRPAYQAPKGALGLHTSPACGIPVAGSLICSGIIKARTVKN